LALIGITNCRKLEDYRQSVLHVGGEVRVLETSADLAGALDGLDGLMLTGGGDVDPMLYGETPHATLDPAEPGRDQFELGLVALARDRQLPIRHLPRHQAERQCGGTLVQDIPSQVPGAMSHRLAVRRIRPWSWRTQDRQDTQLARLMRERLSDTDACEANSRHPQAIRQVAPGSSFRHGAGRRRRGD
jgi:putative glutamine amidotransferase